jgi:hypothetical protein
MLNQKHRTLTGRDFTPWASALTRPTTRSPKPYLTGRVRLSLLWFSCATVVCDAAVTDLFAAYLPVVGPASIRFQVPPKSESAPPPLPGPPAPEIAADTNSASAQGDTTATTPLPESVAAKSPLPIEAEPAGTNDFSQLPPWTLVPRDRALASPTTPSPEAYSAGLAPSASELVTPQMLIPFFYNSPAGTNGVQMGVAGSLMFAPPRPAPRASSKAALKTE